MNLFREIDSKGWLVIAMMGLGNVTLVIAGIAGGAVVSLVILAVIGFANIVLLQINRSLLNSTIEVAQKSTQEWQADRDLIREMTDDYVATVHDLNGHDVQLAGIHLERMRRMLVKRYPQMEDEIAHVQHPLNMPGIII